MKHKTNSLASTSHFKWPSKENGFQMTTWDIKSKAVNITVNEFLKISVDKGLKQCYSFMEILTCLFQWCAKFWDYVPY